MDLPANETLLWALWVIPVIVGAVILFGERKMPDIETKAVSPEHPKCPDCGVYFMPSWTDCEVCAGTASYAIIDAPTDNDSPHDAQARGE